MKPFVDAINNEFCLGDVAVYFDGRAHRLRVIIGGKFDTMNYHLQMVDPTGIVKTIMSDSNQFRDLYIITQQFTSNNDHTWVDDVISKHIFTDSGFKDMSPADPGAIIEPIMKTLDKHESKDFYKRTVYGYNNGTYGRKNDYSLINGKKSFYVATNITIKGNKYKFVLEANAPYPKPQLSNPSYYSNSAIDRWTAGDDQFAARLQLGRATVTITSEDKVVSNNLLDIGGVNPLTCKDVVAKLRSMIEKCQKS